MENSVDTYIDGIIKQVPTLVEKRYYLVTFSSQRRITKIALEFVAKYITPNGEYYVAQTLHQKFSVEDADQNVDSVDKISSTLKSQLEKIRDTLTKDVETHQLTSAPSELVSNLSYKVWLGGSRLRSRYEGSLLPTS